MLSQRVALIALTLGCYVYSAVSEDLDEYGFCRVCCSAFEDAKIDGDFQEDICLRDGCQPENRPKGCSYSGQGRYNKQRSCEIGRDYLFNPDMPANWTFDSTSSGSFYCSLDMNGNAVVSITLSPTRSPTTSPTPSPTDSPTPSPTPFPTFSPTKAPTDSPTPAPTPFPTESPTPSPTNFPTAKPTRAPTESPTPSPTNFPTESPTPAPTNFPTVSPTKAPTLSPTPPTPMPTGVPTIVAELSNTGSTAAGTSLLVVGSVGVVAMLSLLAVILRKRRKRGKPRTAMHSHSRFDGNDNNNYAVESPARRNPLRPIIGVGGRIARNAKALSVRIVNGMQRNPAGNAMTLNGPNPFARTEPSYVNNYAAQTPAPVAQAPSNLSPPPGLPPLRRPSAPPPAGTPGLLPPRQASYLDDDDSSFDNIQF
mmetsp:Transcript_5634/g.6470  ORF Transcript_5634/g.6470 Transcript_5634/m.6470 type:complete len:423 (+) Transcript_5634:215-1483(+)|eukprot:CAMPEP_0184020704 /NCGR_PEP_ID=MMETSP0954-20121128/9505_1 /TAXON_ID=627963 /ORGANISM="Aplanochytrium sp, Strain PBS07" /LENGTH=422 /DNA_ID=CAMNT_0026302611 /DNA_START=205 /DNA_END=1473 /DNA_ORIENTATION=-